MARHEKFNLQNLALLDGAKIPMVFDKEMARIIEDCNDRPLLDKARRVVIVFEAVPVSNIEKNKGSVPAGGTVDCDNVKLKCEIQSSIPKHKTQVYTMTPKNDGSLFFHPDDPEDPDANLLYDEDAERQDDAKRMK